MHDMAAARRDSWAGTSSLSALQMLPPPLGRPRRQGCLKVEMDVLPLFRLLEIWRRLVRDGMENLCDWVTSHPRHPPPRRSPQQDF